ncbi:LysR family transcriptional regulator [Allohahella marinimesophila]|uniref:LysR family transcriptional regulator n=1 Tax=Allohahella marinimesophila TaxID=1054972 RepID=A0ABP7NKC6_9GAMM
MDINLAKTFIEVMNSRSFIRASDKLHVTQTTVTTRIQNLEEQLQVRLFVRNKSGASLTPEGERFAPYANALVQTWARARDELRNPQGDQVCLRIGGETSLWNPLLLSWLLWIRQHEPMITFDARVDNAAILTTDLEHGVLDAVIVHRPLYHPSLGVEQILEEKLIHVQVPGKGEPDISIQWGDDSAADISTVLPRPKKNAFGFNLGLLALHTMLGSGGNGWFRTRVVDQYLRSGRLVRVAGSPEFTYPLFVNHRLDMHSSELDAILAGLRQVAAADPAWVV